MYERVSCASCRIIICVSVKWKASLVDFFLGIVICRPTSLTLPLLAREKNRVEDKKTFANIVLLHSEVYYRMRLSNSNKLKILAEPLIHYLGDLLQDSPKENLYFILIQVRIYMCIYACKGKLLKKKVL